MKLLIPVKTGAGLDAEVAGRFGRAEYFLFYDAWEEKVVSVEPNPYKDLDSDAGVKTALHAVNSDCKAVVGAKTGSRLSAILEEARIEMFVFRNGTAAEAIEWYKSQALKQQAWH